jgi:CrcB protein
MTGILGGFTTFSAFSLDTVTLWQRGEATTAMIYVAASIILSLAALLAGMATVRGLA